jgi:hypothetical protein
MQRLSTPLLFSSATVLTHVLNLSRIVLLSLSVLLHLLFLAASRLGLFKVLQTRRSGWYLFLLHFVPASLLAGQQGSDHPFALNCMRIHEQRSDVKARVRSAEPEVH